MNGKSQGYFYVMVAIAIFAFQDGVTKYLGSNYSPIYITMLRYWFFALFAITIAMRSGGIAKAAQTKRLGLQILRGILLAVEILIFVYALSLAGMAISQAITQAAPLLVTLLSVPFLGEKVGWRRALAIVVGFIGVLFILNPIGASFNELVFIPIAGTLLYACYSVATRAVGKVDSPVTSVFYTGIVGAIIMTVAGMFHVEPIAPGDWVWIAALCACGVFSHYFLIKAYSILEAGEVQPLTYFQLVIGTFIAVGVFHEKLTWNLVVGAIIVVAAGLFTIFRERKLSRQAQKAGS